MPRECLKAWRKMLSLKTSIKKARALTRGARIVGVGAVLLASHSATAGLIGKWTFNEGGGTLAYDYTAAANNGTIFGAPNGAKYVAAPGETSSNYALHFDGLDDFVQYIHLPSYDVNGDFSMEAWVRL